MALRLRRGTDAERQLITFAEGELVYTTDTKKLYVGDGETLGGILVASGGSSDNGGFALSNDPTPFLGADLNLNSFDVFGIGNIEINGNIDANIVSANFFEGDGSGLVNVPGADGIIDGGSYQINIIGDDSSIILDSNLRRFIGDVNSSSIRTTRLLVDIFEEDQGIQILTDKTSNDEEADILTIVCISDSAEAPASFLVRGKGIDVDEPDPVGEGDKIFQFSFIGLSSGPEGASISSLIEASVDGPVIDDIIPGKITISTEDNTGNVSPVVSFDSKRNSIFNGPVKLASYIDIVERDSQIVTPESGMMIFLQSTSKFQGYDGTDWVDLN